jgi:glucan 1,3-beta-glucosidase
MRVPIAFFAVSAAAVLSVWVCLGSDVKMPQAPLAASDKLHCISYSPFRDAQSPLDGPVNIELWQIDEDLARLAKLTRCVRTYSIEFGLDRVAESARRHGLKVLQGVWLSSSAEKNRVQVETTVALAAKFPDVIEGIIVGNEVLLRGEMSAIDIANTIRGVKARVGSVPVTYADVWEFWLRAPQIYEAVDFITIHILPYWEDFPVTAAEAGTHVDAIRKKVAAAYPAKEILIGEVGWPSAGRMREGALPSLANQARVVQDVLAFAKRDNVRVNVIEAFDQPWKRRLEGTVGGYWGIFDNEAREPKFIWGEAVSNHPHWHSQALFGLVVAAAACVAGFFARRETLGIGEEAAIAAIAIAGGAMTPWAAENMWLESLGAGGWLRSGAMVLAALTATIFGAAMVAAREPIPSLTAILNPRRWPSSASALVYGATLVVTVSLALQAALMLVFDPRYRDFPFAPMTAAIVPFLVHSLLQRHHGQRGQAEIAAAALLAISVVYIVPNEMLANWQSLWLCAAFAALALTLVRVRGAPG